MKRLSRVWIPAAFLLAAACQSNDLGSGANTVDRDFAKPASDVWKASVKSAESMGLTVVGDSHDQFGGELVACRANGDPVRVWVRSVDDTHSQVSVRVEPGDHSMALMFQERIAEKLGLGEAKAALLGGNSVEGVYATDLVLATGAARRTLKALQVTIKDEESHAQWSRIDGRQKDSTPVRIRIDRIEDEKTKVTFIAGNERGDDHKAFALRMKEEFETMTQTRESSN
jgi:hypothetical protein